MIEEILKLDAKEADKRLAGLGFSQPQGALDNLERLARGPFARVLGPVLSAAALSPSPDGALNNLETISSSVPEDAVAAALEKSDTVERLVTICGSSQYLSGVLARNPGLFSGAFAGNLLAEAKDLDAFRDGLARQTSGAGSVDELARALREYRHAEYLRIGARDLLGIAGLEETTQELSELAGACLDRAVEFALESVKQAHGSPMYVAEDGAEREAEFAVIGLGKLGGNELNFCSDIDIMYVYTSDEGQSAGLEGRPETKTGLHAFFVKVAHVIGRLISNVTDAGFVFRIDLDLRPEGRSGALANSLEGLETYYESWGLSWERAAMIKARPVAGGTELGGRFMEMIRPFVYRRYMDFTVLEEIKSMKEKVDASLARRNPDTVDVKLGAGGIREIEFFCQALQLVHAGKDPGVRESNTLGAIDRLRTSGYIEKEEARTLKDGYAFLRKLEHRIQIVEGRQSQAIPARKEELERLARMMGFVDTTGKKAGEFFWEDYKRITAAVHDVYRSLFYKSEGSGEKTPANVTLLLSADTPDAESLAALAELGFRDPPGALANVALLRNGGGHAHSSARARVLFERLAPMMLSRVASTPEPDRALSFLVRFISSVGARATFYSLLYENRRVLDDLVRLFGSSEFLSRTLVEQPGGLEQLLSRELTTPYRTRAAIRNEILAGVAGAPDYEEKLEALRRLKNQEVFRVGVNDIAGRVSQARVCSQMTFVAEASLEAAVRMASEELRGRHGTAPGSFCVLGLGKLGGTEMIYGSDLDILFVYSAPEDAATSGGNRISAHEFYVKLGQRIISALTLRTRWGFVFNVDARLRPSGRPLVLSADALLEYHSRGTSVWERQALTKARPVAGDPAFGAGLAAKLLEAVYSRGLADTDIDEMLRIRSRMEAEIAMETQRRYNIKAGRGGINDIEFLVQAVQLKWGGVKKGLRTPRTQKALLRVFREGLMGKGDFVFLKKAYGFLRFLELRQRIAHDRPEGDLIKGSAELAALGRRVGYSGDDPGEALLSEYTKHAEKIRELYLKTLDGLRESGHSA